MSVLLIDDLEWHDINGTGLPLVNSECYIKLCKHLPNGEKTQVYDIVRVMVRQSMMPHNFGETFFYRPGDFKRNVFHLHEVEAWAKIPEGDPEIKRLLPCPFCGGKATLHYEEAYEDDYGDMPAHWWVGCDNGVLGTKRCHMLVQTGLFLSKAKAIDAWNTRTGVNFMI